MEIEINWMTLDCGILEDIRADISYGDDPAPAQAARFLQVELEDLRFIDTEERTGDMYQLLLDYLQDNTPIMQSASTSSARLFQKEVFLSNEYGYGTIWIRSSDL